MIPILPYFVAPRLEAALKGRSSMQALTAIEEH